jgi:catechol 2,3-dioxygenase-like lactoylglutathione lyase family enzyme
MLLHHVALNIHTSEEVIDFYQNILKLELAYQFELPEELSRSVFGINQSLPAFFCKNRQVAFELFVVPEKTKKGGLISALKFPIGNS